MKSIDEYHRATERSHEENSYVGKCGDQTGIDGDDTDKLCPALGEVVQDVINYFQPRGRELPAGQTLPMAEIGRNSFPCAETLDAQAFTLRDNWKTLTSSFPRRWEGQVDRGTQPRFSPNL